MTRSLILAGLGLMAGWMIVAFVHQHPLIALATLPVPVAPIVLARVVRRGA